VAHYIQSLEDFVEGRPLRQPGAAAAEDRIPGAPVESASASVYGVYEPRAYTVDTHGVPVDAAEPELPPEIAKRCQGTVGTWCGKFLMQKPIPSKVRRGVGQPGRAH
jgi:hypothetical protein